MSHDTVSPETIRDLHDKRLYQLRGSYVATAALLFYFFGTAFFRGLRSTFRSEWEALIPLALLLYVAWSERRAWRQLKDQTPQDAFDAKRL